MNKTHESRLEEIILNLSRALDYKTLPKPCKKEISRSKNQTEEISIQKDAVVEIIRQTLMIECIIASEIDQYDYIHSEITNAEDVAKLIYKEIKNRI